MEKYSIEYIVDVINSEGLAYAITDYLGANQIEDKELSILWRNVAQAIEDVKLYIEERMGEDFEWE
jgi:hypothetical protein